MRYSGDVVTKMLSDVVLPSMVRIRQTFDRQYLPDVSAEVQRELREKRMGDQLKPRMKVAVTCGSRGITDIALVVKEVCSFVKACSADPFILPAMGSHGGDATGQREILESYGVTEDFCGAPIRATAQSTLIGYTNENEGVYINSYAAQADRIIIINRIKAHTDFRGPYESGILKMMVVGLGGIDGAQRFHERGPAVLSERLQALGDVVIKNAPILCGVGILENAYDETRKISVMRKEEILTREPELLREAKQYMGRLMFDDIDLLIVDQFGKDISGSGMDPNIAGTFVPPMKHERLRVNKRTVLDLTENSHGNFAGIGSVDTITKRCFEKFDLEKTYPNCIVDTTVDTFKAPLIFNCDFEAIAACIKLARGIDRGNPRIVRIRDTLHVSEFLISAALVPLAKENSDITILSEAKPMQFDSRGDLVDRRVI